MATTAPIVDSVYPGLTPAERSAVDRYLAETGADRGDVTRVSWPALRRLVETIDPPGCSDDATAFIAGEALTLLALIHGDGSL